MATEPAHKDLDYQQATIALLPLVREGVQVYLKWTCSRCKERVLSDDPMTFDHDTQQLIWHAAYRHTHRDDGTPCGQLHDTRTGLFGCMLVYKNADPVEVLRNLANRLDASRERN